MELDALDLADVITDQVRKLGAHSRTKKAIQIFGYVGQQTQIIEFGGSSDPAALHLIRRTMGHRTMTHLVLESLGSFMEDIITVLLQWTGDMIRWLWKTINASSLILVILGISILTNAFFSTRETSEWWKERNASKYMKKLGVGPNLVMNKAIYLHDLVPATTFNGTSFGSSSGAWYVHY